MSMSDDEKKKVRDWQKEGHKGGCRCFACDNGMEAVNKWQDECMKRDGFYMHFVPLPHGYVNAHTHGFKETWGHPDLQVVIPLPQQVMSSIFWNFANRVKKGEAFKAGDLVDKIISGHPVKLIDAKEEGRPILRVLLPDPKWRYPGDTGCTEIYEAQTTLETDYQDATKRN